MIFPSQLDSTLLGSPEVRLNGPSNVWVGLELPARPEAPNRRGWSQVVQRGSSGRVTSCGEKGALA